MHQSYIVLSVVICEPPRWVSVDRDRDGVLLSFEAMALALRTTRDTRHILGGLASRDLGIERFVLGFGLGGQVLGLRGHTTHKMSFWCCISTHHVACMVLIHLASCAVIFNLDRIMNIVTLTTDLYVSLFLLTYLLTYQ